MSRTGTVDPSYQNSALELSNALANITLAQAQTMTATADRIPKDEQLTEPSTAPAPVIETYPEGPQFKDDYIFNINIPGKPGAQPVEPTKEEKAKAKQKQLMWAGAILAAVVLLVIFVSMRKPKSSS